MRLILAMKINRVNVLDASVQERLSILQSLCLPHDKPYDTTRGDWWIVRDAFNIDCAFGGIVASQRWSDTGYLCRAGVIPTHRGNGLQRRLIRARIRQARELGWNWVITDTYHNPASANSLIAVGFKMFEPTIPWGANGTLYWRFNLRK